MKEERTYVGRPAVVGAAEGESDAPRTNVDWPRERPLDTSVRADLRDRIGDAVRRVWNALADDAWSSMRRP
jgi:hypothetical protein